MLPRPEQSFSLDAGRRAFKRAAISWWHMVYLGSVVMVLGLSPSTYNKTNRALTARFVYTSTWDVLPWFTSMSALLSLVLIRVVIVSAISYGLSQYALEMVVRVLVLELIPLSAAMFVALRSGMTIDPNAGMDEGPKPTRFMPDLAHLRSDLVPRVIACAFSVLTLAVVSSMIALVLAYLTVHGFSPWGLPGYTRTVGHVFDLPVTLGFGLKTLFFSLAVAIVPVAAKLEASQAIHPPSVQPGAVRLFLVLLLIEAASLSVKYI